VTNINIKNID